MISKKKAKSVICRISEPPLCVQEMVTHCSTLALEIPWTEEPGATVHEVAKESDTDTTEPLSARTHTVPTLYSRTLLVIYFIHSSVCMLTISNVNLNYRHPCRHTQNNVWPNVWALHSLIMLKHKTNHHKPLSCFTLTFTPWYFPSC